MSDGMKSLTAWREWVRDHPAVAALLAGLVATQIATVVGFWLPGIGLPQLDWNRTNGAVYTPHTSATEQFVSGGVLHYLDGIVLGVIFAVGVRPFLPGRATALGNMIKALIMGTALSVISLVFMIPRVYYRGMDAGFFSHNFGFKLILAVFVWHWVWGLHLGMIFNPAAHPDREAKSPQPASALPALSLDAS